MDEEYLTTKNIFQKELKPQSIKFVFTKGSDSIPIFISFLKVCHCTYKTQDIFRRFCIYERDHPQNTEKEKVNTSTQ